MDKPKSFTCNDTIDAYHLEMLRRNELKDRNVKTPEKDPFDDYFSKPADDISAEQALDEAMKDVDDVIEKLKDPKGLTYISESMRALRIFGVRMFNKRQPIN